MRETRGGASVTLAPFASVDRSALRWLRTSDAPLEFTLSAGDVPVAVLRWATHRGSFATAETAGGTAWTLKRTGFLTPRLTVRAEGTSVDLATLTAHLRHHSIELASGDRYLLRRASLLLPAWTVSNAAGGEVLHIEPVPEGRKLGGGAVLVAPSASPSEALLLAVLAWYFIGLSWFEDETAEALAPFEGPDAPESISRRS